MNRITYQPDRRLSSSRGLAPRAIEWCVHSGDAMIEVDLAERFGKISGPEASSEAGLDDVAPGGREVVLVRLGAISHVSTAPTISTPAFFAPQLLPPPPQNRSMPLTSYRPCAAEN